MQTLYRRLILGTAVLTFALVVLGAYVRLADAGLGCPDWPGCYGELTPHHAAAQIRAAEAFAPYGPVSMAKAWKEMAHRYLAGAVGLLIVAIAALAWRQRRALGQSPWLPTLLVALVGLQAMFGKWTVTMLLKPAIVTGHLIGGMLTLGLLAWLAARQLPAPPRCAVAPGLRLAAAAALLVLAAQIVLGGWVSTNYAALACSDLPTCQGEWLPPMDFGDAFHVVRELGRSAEGEFLSREALTAIHWLHRVGAVITLGVLGALGLALLRAGATARLGALLLAAAGLQFALGLANVAFGLPLALAAAHNAGAALLVVVLVSINQRLAASRRAQ
jgi:cytochrome c oxidase assembly protein subunit 15